MTPVGAQVVPRVQFLNPSSFATAGEKGIIVSDLPPDEGPGCCEGARSTYRLSAWVSNAPPGSRVFFSVVQRALDFEITETTATTPNTWEASWSIPATVLDGPATLFAYLVVGEEPIAVDEQDITILRVESNAQLTYPSSGGAFGSHAALGTALPADAQSAARKSPIGVVDASYSLTPDISYVRAFYTTSPPGTEPDWNACGTEVVGTGSNSRAGNGVRCTLAPEDQLGVTAIAAVTNDSPDDYEARFNQSGDAVGVSSAYAQQPTDLSLVTEGLQRVDREPTSDRVYCGTAETVSLTDQVGRAIAGANVDVHATGPNDQLKFDTFSVLTINQAPDRGNHAEETAFDCTGEEKEAPTTPPANANPDSQGEHQRFGAPDRKHIESLGGGTSDIGRFSFRMHSTEEGQTDFTVWLDEADDGCLTNDDAFTEGEFHVSGALGWGENPDLGLAQPFEPLVACEGPSSEPPPVEEDGSRTVSMRFAQDRIFVGEPVRFSGRIRAVDPTCAIAKKVVLRIRKPGGKFAKAATTTTNARGRFTFTKKARVPRDYRADAPAAGFCERARSAILTLR